MDISLATVTTSASQQKVDKAALVTKASIPKDGSGKAFGYGIITGIGMVIVTTTHKGVLDSEAQHGDANNPVFHNHYGTLVAGTDECRPDLKVDKISFDSPGKVTVGGSAVSLKNLPKSSSNPVLTQNNQVDSHNGVVSFKLALRNGAVCVTDVHAADKIIVK